MTANPATSHPSKTKAPTTFDYDAIDAGYYDRVFDKAQGIQSKWHHLKFDRIRKYLEPNQYHLDIACGPGTFIGTLDETIKSVGVDIASPQIAYARDKYGAPHRQFELVDGGRLPFSSNTFDVLTCIELAEHLPVDECRALFEEAGRVAKPGGRFLVTTPDYGGLWPALEWILNRVGEVSYEDQHITHFTRRSLLSLLAEAGFEEIEVTRYQFMAPFTVPLGWRFADLFARWEPKLVTSRLGFLLIAEARGPKRRQSTKSKARKNRSS